MEWYFWALIAYAVIVWLNVIVAYIKSESKSKIDFLLVPATYILSLIIAPFIWLIALERLISYEVYSYETFTIHPLTEDNKIALRNLGFKEGEFLALNNIPYAGFQKDGVVVLYDGRVNARYIYRLNRTQNFLIGTIKNLPTEVTLEERASRMMKEIKYQEAELKEKKAEYSKVRVKESNKVADGELKAGKKKAQG